jgi:hypothetical protein
MWVGMNSQVYLTMIQKITRWASALAPRFTDDEDVIGDDTA